MQNIKKLFIYLIINQIIFTVFMNNKINNKYKFLIVAIVYNKYE